MLLSDCSSIWGKPDVREDVRKSLAQPVPSMRPTLADMVPQRVYECVVIVPRKIVSIFSLLSQLREDIKESRKDLAKSLEIVIKNDITQLKRSTADTTTLYYLDEALKD